MTEPPHYGSSLPLSGAGPLVCFWQLSMGKRSRGPPPGTEGRKAKRQPRELRQLRKYAFGEVDGMRQAGYRTWVVTRPSPRTRGSWLWPSWSGSSWTPWSATPAGKCRPRTRRRHTPCSVSSSCLSRRGPPAGYGPRSLCRSPIEGPTWACGSGCKAGLRW